MSTYRKIPDHDEWTEDAIEVDGVTVTRAMCDAGWDASNSQEAGLDGGFLNGHTNGLIRIFVAMLKAQRAEKV